MHPTHFLCDSFPLPRTPTLARIALCHLLLLWYLTCGTKTFLHARVVARVSCKPARCHCRHLFATTLGGRAVHAFCIAYPNGTPS